MSLPLDEGLDLIEGAMLDWAWRRDMLSVFGGDPKRVPDLLSRAGEVPLFGKG